MKTFYGKAKMMTPEISSGMEVGFQTKLGLAMGNLMVKNVALLGKWL